MVRSFAHGAMGRQIDPSWSGPIELFLIPASAPRLVYVILSVGGGAYKRTLAVNRRVAHVAALGFLSRYLNGPLPYV